MALNVMTALWSLRSRSLHAGFWAGERVMVNGVGFWAGERVMVNGVGFWAGARVMVSVSTSS
ncbi:conserved hypothetical protein [Lacticaseibacillus paracasei]|nr:conserved hypothetical protein [Lacticaseibacillus paracasei]